MIRVDLSGAQPFFTAAGPDYALAALAHRTLADKSGLGADFTGWVELPRRVKATELDAICAAAETIRARSKALVVIGIGGSYLGARGAIELLKPRPGKDDPKVFFMGNTLSVDAVNDTIEALGEGLMGARGGGVIGARAGEERGSAGKIDFNHGVLLLKDHW